VAERHIVGLGGGGDSVGQTDRLYEYILGLAGKPRPRVLFIPTASAEHPDYIVWFYERFAARGEASHLNTFPWPPKDVRDVILAQDVINVGGGNTANMLAIWKVHGIDTALREAWENGVVLCGASAGMICWFESGVTDSFGPQLEGMDCLGFLPGSACPHYDDEERRRPVYTRLVADGFPAGVAADDDVALHFVGTEISEVVTCRPGATAYRVTRDGETRLDAKEL